MQDSKQKKSPKLVALLVLLALTFYVGFFLLVTFR